MQKRMLLGSVPSVMFLLTMFVSSTFAWFTDLAVNSGNRVQSGNLLVGFAASEVLNEDNSNLGGSIQDLKTSENPVFNLGDAAQPGDSQQKYLRIRNEGNIAINYQVDFVVTTHSRLAEVILFEIQPLGGNTQTVVGTAIDSAVYISLRDTTVGSGGLLRASEEVPQEYEIWRVKMLYNPEAGNEYNDASLAFEVDIEMKAWQFNYPNSQGGSYQSSNTSSSSQTNPSSSTSNSSSQETMSNNILNANIKVTSFNPMPFSSFGQSIASFGDYVVVGAPSYNDTGVAYLYDVKVSLELPLRIFQASDKSQFDYFGASVGIFGDNILIGAYGKSSLSGAAYLYKISDPIFERKIVPSDIDIGDFFGLRLTINGDNILISSVFDDTEYMNTGSAYIFKISDPSFERKIIPSDISSEEYFGDGISLEGNFVLIGKPSDDNNTGSAYLYKINDPTFERKIIASDLIQGVFFGQSVSLFGTYFAISSTHDNTNGKHSGAVYIFRIDDTNYERKITSSVNETEVYFGWPVVIKEDNIYIGSRGNNGMGQYSGSVNVFKFSDINFETILKGFDSSPGDHFGLSISIGNEYLFIGAPLKKYGESIQTGAIYLFELENLI